ncbi:MAG: hypothetical protein ACM3PV_01295 [Betaproteobacteria bacterium]
MKLDAWLKQNRSLVDRLRVVERLAQALNEVHDRGEPLAALQPETVDVAGDGRCDLSAGRKGTPAPGYAAPERTEGGPPSLEADIYSAGAIAWEVLAGSPCGPAPSHLSEAQPDVAQELADAVMACLERSAQWRPRDLTYLAQLAQHAQGTRRSAEAPARSVAPRPAPRAASVRSARASASRSGGDGGSATRLRLAIGAVLALAAVGAVAYFWLGSPSERAAGPAASAPTTTAPVSPAATPTAVAAAPQPTPSVALTAQPVQSPTPPAPALPSPTPVSTPAVRPTLPPAATVAPPPAATPRTRPAVDTTPAAVPPAAAGAPVPAPVTPVTTVAPAAAAANTATPTPTPAPARGPVTLTALSPLTARRGGKVLLDLRGTGLYDGVRVRILPLRDAPRGISMVRQKVENDTLLRVLVDLDAQVTPAPYAIVLEDAEGRQTKPVTFTVTK